MEDLWSPFDKHFFLQNWKNDYDMGFRSTLELGQYLVFIQTCMYGNENSVFRYGLLCNYSLTCDKDHVYLETCTEIPNIDFPKTNFNGCIHALKDLLY